MSSAAIGLQLPQRAENNFHLPGMERWHAPTSGTEWEKAKNNSYHAGSSAWIKRKFIFYYAYFN